MMAWGCPLPRRRQRGRAIHQRHRAPASVRRRRPVGAAGARSGLLTHGALIALAGGSLSVGSGDSSGAVVTIRAPRSSDLGSDLGGEASEGASG